ncbi:MAG: hypothetical protein U1F57_03290 [bacterium]
MTDFTASAGRVFPALGDAPQNSSVLDRFREQSLAGEARLTPFQRQADQMVEGFLAQATDWRSLTAMMAGGLAFRLGRIGTLALPLGTRCAPFLNLASYGLGLVSEVTAFETTHRALLSAQGVVGLWNWEGQSGFREGWLSSLITFGMLKGVGHATQAQNVLFQHLSSDLAMVGGHHAASELGFMAAPEGSFAEQMLHAEATNLQLGAGSSLFHTATGGRLLALERSLDLALSTRIPLTRISSLPRSSLRENFSRFRQELANQSLQIAGSLVWLCMGVGGGTIGRGPRRGPRTTEEIVGAIRREMAAFARPLETATAEQFEKDKEFLRNHPVLGGSPPVTALEHYVASSWTENGYDPWMVIHNTGADPLQMQRIISGDAKGGFPVSTFGRTEDPAYYAHSVLQFAAQRNQPYLTLEAILPASRLARWLVEHSASFQRPSFHGGSYDIPAHLMRSLLETAREEGSVKILALPGTPMRDPAWGKLEESIRKAGFSPDILIQAEGRNFWDIQSMPHAYPFLPHIEAAATEWVRNLSEAIRHSRENYIENWVQYIRRRRRGINTENYSGGELLNDLPLLAAEARLPPPTFGLSEAIRGRLFARLEKEARGKRSGPTGGALLLALAATGAGLTLLDPSVVYGAVPGEMHGSDPLSYLRWGLGVFAVGGIFSRGIGVLKDWWGRVTQERDSPPPNPFPLLPLNGARNALDPYRSGPDDPVPPFLEPWRRTAVPAWQLATVEQTFKEHWKSEHARGVISYLAQEGGRETILNILEQTGLQDPRVRALLETGIVQRIVKEYVPREKALKILEETRQLLVPHPNTPNWVIPLREVAEYQVDSMLPVADFPFSAGVRQKLYDFYEGLCLYRATTNGTQLENYDRLVEQVRKRTLHSTMGFNTPLGNFGMHFLPDNEMTEENLTWRRAAILSDSVRFLLEDSNLEVRREALRVYLGFLRNYRPRNDREREQMAHPLNPLFFDKDPEILQNAKEAFRLVQLGRP